MLFSDDEHGDGVDLPSEIRTSDSIPYPASPVRDTSTGRGLHLNLEDPHFDAPGLGHLPNTPRQTNGDTAGAGAGLNGNSSSVRWTTNRPHRPAHWALVSAQHEEVEPGKEDEVSALDRHQVRKLTGVPPRDLRVMDPSLSYPSSIMIRERALVVNLEHVKAIITADFMLLQQLDSPAVKNFLQKTRKRLIDGAPQPTERETGELELESSLRSALPRKPKGAAAAVASMASSRAADFLVRSGAISAAAVGKRTERCSEGNGTAGPKAPSPPPKGSTLATCLALPPWPGATQASSGGKVGAGAAAANGSATFSAGRSTSMHGGSLPGTLAVPAALHSTSGGKIPKVLSTGSLPILGAAAGGGGGGGGALGVGAGLGGSAKLKGRPNSCHGEGLPELTSGANSGKAATRFGIAANGTAGGALSFSGGFGLVGPGGAVGAGPEDGPRGFGLHLRPVSEEGLAFELRALECCLQEVSDRLCNQVDELARDAAPIFDRLTRGVNKNLLETARRFKTQLARLENKVENVHDALEKLLDSEAELHDMCLTRKRNHALALAAEGHGVGSAGNSWSNGLGRARDGGHGGGGGDGGGNGPYKGSPALGPRRDSKLGGGQVERDAIEDVENCIEAYFEQIDGAAKKLDELREYIANAEDYVAIELDSHRNQLIQLDAVLTIATLCVSCYSCLGSIFGMNLRFMGPEVDEDSLEPPGPKLFKFVTLAGLFGSTLVFVIVLLYCRRLRLLFV